MAICGNARRKPAGPARSYCWGRSPGLVRTVLDTPYFVGLAWADRDAHGLEGLKLAQPLRLHWTNHRALAHMKGS